MLFNAVLEDVFRDVRPDWCRKRVGLEMSIGSTAYLSHLCFADDVVLIAANAQQMKMMVQDLREAAAKRGRKIHSGKTKVLTNASGVIGSAVPKSIVVGDEHYDVLDYDGSTKYLGRKVCYNDPHETEFNNRVAKAWDAFTKYRHELTDRRHKLPTRLKLFDAVVSSTLLYGCESWTLRVDHQRRLTVIQRKMLRMVLNAKRRSVPTDGSDDSQTTDTSDIESEATCLEPWPEFLKRTALWTDEQLVKSGLHQWVVQWKTRKRQWAAKLMAEGTDKWSSTATLWRPSVHSSSRLGRRQARPKRRWDQNFVEYIASAMPDNHWQEFAKDPKTWLSHTSMFANAQAQFSA